MNADAGVDVRMIGRRAASTCGQLGQIDADAQRVRHAILGHRLEHVGKLARELGEIDMTVGIDEHGARSERIRSDHDGLSPALLQSHR